jgi:hypothetical protein
LGEDINLLVVSVDLDENSNFRVFDDSLVNVDAEENVVLSSSGQENIDKDDDDIHIEDYDGVDDDSIDEEEEEENSD